MSKGERELARGSGRVSRGAARCARHRRLCRHLRAAQPERGVSTITLEADGTYTWRAPDETETSGEFTWGEDNSRILITRDGETDAFAVAEDVLYRLPTEDAPLAGERSEETTWSRSDPTPTDDNQADRPGE